MTRISWTLMVVVAVTAFCAHLTQAILGIPSFLEIGTCAEVNLTENFDPVKYSGLWFDIESVPNEYQHTKKCVTQNYTWNGEQMDVATRGLTHEDEKVRQSALMVKDYDTGNPASMIVQATGVPEAPYQVIATDYRTFSCVYSCLDGYVGFMAEFMWVFSRTPTLPAAKIKYCYDIFLNMGVNPEKMVPVVQENPCPYYEKLDQMLAESKKHLDKFVGPGQSFTPPPIPTTHHSTPTQPTMQDNEMQELLDVVHEEREFIEELRHDLGSDSRSHDQLSGGKGTKTHDSTNRGKARGSSVRDADPNVSSTTLPATPLFLLLLALLQLGAVIVFTGLLSVGFLGRRLQYFHWLGIAVVLTGLVIVGMSDFISSGESSQDTNSIITGDLLIIMAQVVSATQMVVEERFITKYNVPPLLVVGWEGTFGFLTLSLLLVPMYFIPAGKLSGNERGTLEDAIDAFVQIGNSGLLAASLVLNVISIAFFNFTGVSVTKEFSATTRMVLDSVRTLVIWVFTLGVKWETFQYLQPIGFFILVVGMMLYNDILILPFLRQRGVIRGQREPEAMPVLEGVDEVDKGSKYGGTIDPF